jgi:hypothetical protein
MKTFPHLFMKISPRLQITPRMGGWIDVFKNISEFKNNQPHNHSPNVKKAINQRTHEIWWRSGNRLRTS